jgi:K+-sensing histidine kinase KdpD
MGTDCISKMVLLGEIKSGPAASELHDMLEELETATDSIEDMLRNLNNFQLLEEKKFELKMEPFFLGDMINGANEMVRLQLQDLKLNFKVANDLPELVMGNYQLMTLFLVYVILNSSKRSGVTSAVHVDIKRAKPAKEHEAKEATFPLIINVTDTGNRMEDLEIEEIFSAFSTLETCNDIDKV